MNKSVFIQEQHHLVKALTQPKANTEFAQAIPFKHIVIDNVFSDSFVNALIDEFPTVKQLKTEFTKYQGKRSAAQLKFGCPDWAKFKSNVFTAMSIFNSSVVCEALSALTHIQGLFSDPWLKGGGMHNTLSGGQLATHIDANFHSDIMCHRRVNLILFVSPNWLKSWGGQLNLWDSTGTKEIIRSLSVKKNRLVLFETNEISFHSVSTVNCSKSKARQSLACYYYTSQRSKAETAKPHPVIWKDKVIANLTNM